MSLRRRVERTGYALDLTRRCASAVLLVHLVSCTTDSLGVSLGAEPSDPAYNELRRRTDVTVPTALGTCSPGDCTPDEF